MGLARPSLGALALTGGFLELARVGIGNGGSLASGRLGLRGRWWLTMPFWIIAALRMMLDLLEDAPSTDERAMRFDSDLLGGASRCSMLYTLPGSVLPPNGRVGFRPPLILRDIGRSTELRLPPRAPAAGLGADRAVRNSLSLASPSINSSASSELPPSKPANKLLIRGGLRIGAL